MMHAFQITGDRLVAEASPGECQVLASLVADVAELLGAEPLAEQDLNPEPDDQADDSTTVQFRLDPLPVPDDPAVLRLLPDASMEDAEVAAEFRRLTEDDLRQEKIARLADLYRMLKVGMRIDLPLAEGPRLAATFTDLRLVLGDRLELTDEESTAQLEEDLLGESAAPPENPAGRARQYLGSAYLALGWWQESLMTCLLAELD